MSRKHRAVDDAEYLRKLGYEPILSRRMSGFGNFAISFSVISVLSGCMTLFAYGLNYGGPAVMLWGWLAVGTMVMAVGAALAEVTSVYPTSGALYVMAERLSGGRRWGWYTGWLNLLGLLGGIAGIDYGASLFTGAFMSLQWGITPDSGTIMVIFCCILLLHALLNLFGVRVVSLLNSVSVWWHVAGVVLIAGLLFVVPSNHQSAGFVFGHFVNNTGFHNQFYVSALGLLLAQYTYCGYDASAHLSEETRNAGVAAAQGIVRAIWWSLVAGFVLLAALLFAIQDYAGTLNTSTGVAPAQIFLDALGVTGAKALLLVVIGAQLFCGNAEVTACSRMIFAFSRDGGLPGSKYLYRVSTRTGTPVAAVWLAVGVPLVLALPSLWSPTAYAAITSINVLGMTPAYAIPIWLRLRYRHSFTPGAWNLGRWGVPIASVAVLWVACVTILFCLPQAWPLTVNTFNYAPVAFFVALALAWIWYRISGRRNYHVPQQTIATHDASYETI
ncbi:amino acid permease [Streptomyces sp. BV129]|uniref:amino acid permease n=1 Tax=Streptomyces sp. BV129 TaxID=2849671 RepID=UPI001C2E9C19|nr:amino acid permease [Streptomyces sp. BV129]MBV1949082.1 amino acid permease [Streptomyces sp. BV129]